MGTETWGGVNSGAAEKRRPVESLSDFDRQFNKKRSEGIGIDLASLAYDFEEGEVNIETVRYMAKRLERELFGMDNDPTSPTYEAYRRLDRIVIDATTAGDPRLVAELLKEAITCLDKMKGKTSGPEAEKLTLYTA